MHYPRWLWPTSWALDCKKVVVAPDPRVRNVPACSSNQLWENMWWHRSSGCCGGEPFLWRQRHILRISHHLYGELGFPSLVPEDSKGHVLHEAFSISFILVGEFVPTCGDCLHGNRGRDRNRHGRWIRCTHPPWPKWTRRAGSSPMCPHGCAAYRRSASLSPKAVYPGV